MSTNSTIQNFINGNLQDAKKQAKRHSSQVLLEALTNDFFYDNTQALYIANYLKNKITFTELNQLIIRQG